MVDLSRTPARSVLDQLLQAPVLRELDWRALNPELSGVLR